MYRFNRQEHPGIGTPTNEKTLTLRPTVFLVKENADFTANYIPRKEKTLTFGPLYSSSEKTLTFGPLYSSSTSYRYQERLGIGNPTNE